MARKMQRLHRDMLTAIIHGEGSGAFRWRSGGMYRPGVDRPASVDSASRKGNAGAVVGRGSCWRRCRRIPENCGIPRPPTMGGRQLQPSPASESPTTIPPAGKSSRPSMPKNPGGNPQLTTGTTMVPVAPTLSGGGESSAREIALHNADSNHKHGMHLAMHFKAFVG